MTADSGPHDLRHTAATLLLLEGVQLLVVSEMLGHASVALTLATYGHVQAEMTQDRKTSRSRELAERLARLRDHVPRRHVGLL